MLYDSAWLASMPCLSVSMHAADRISALRPRLSPWHGKGNCKGQGMRGLLLLFFMGIYLSGSLSPSAVPDSPVGYPASRCPNFGTMCSTQIYLAHASTSPIGLDHPEQASREHIGA